ncbi:MAG TPA: hypothetical protein VM691_09110, partial [Myxococcales bacterium]|nr:hypothetical protein [Myxococcales bacterium]
MLGLLILAAADACTLLTAKEIEAVQRERPQVSKPTSQSAGELNVRQCFYQLPTFEKSVSLEVTSGAGAKAYWRKAFHEERREGEEEEEKERPERVKGLGEEAFWTGSARLGGLYVLKKGSILRLSIGGAESKDAKLA